MEGAFIQSNWTPHVVYNAQNVYTDGAVPAPDLNDSFTLSCETGPLDGGSRVDFGGDVGETYTGGVKFSLALGNNGSQRIFIQSMRLRISHREFSAGHLTEKEPAYGAILIPHQLFIEVFPERYEGWWMLSDGARLSGPRVVTSDDADLFDSTGNARMSFVLGNGDMELVDGAIYVGEPGLYDVRLQVLALSAAQERVAKGPKAFRICHVET